METNTGNGHGIFFFSDLASESPRLRRQITKMPTAIVSSNHLALTQDIKTHQPKALIVDVDFCKRKSLAVRKFLERQAEMLRTFPVYLVNANFTEFHDLVSGKIIYAIMDSIPEPQEISKSISKYYALREKAGPRVELRQEVAAKCLLKKVGEPGILDGYLVDLSTAGMKVRLHQTAEIWDIGDELRFTITDTSAEESADHVHGVATLKWKGHSFVEPTLQPLQQPTVVGLMFSEVSDTARMRISGLLNHARN